MDHRKWRLNYQFYHYFFFTYLHNEYLYQISSKVNQSLVLELMWNKQIKEFYTNLQKKKKKSLCHPKGLESQPAGLRIHVWATGVGVVDLLILSQVPHLQLVLPEHHPTQCLPDRGIEPRLSEVSVPSVLFLLDSEHVPRVTLHCESLRATCQGGMFWVKWQRMPLCLSHQLTIR